MNIVDEDMITLAETLKYNKGLSREDKKFIEQLAVIRDRADEIPGLDITHLQREHLARLLWNIRDDVPAEEMFKVGVFRANYGLGFLAA